MMRYLYTAFTILAFILLHIAGMAQTDTTVTDSAEKLVYVIPVQGAVMPKTWRLAKEGFAKAKELEADAVIIKMNTPGGTVSEADSIRTSLLKTEVPTAVFIDNNAASAGAFISISCDSIFMHPSGTMGAATVVDGSGQKLSEKYQSYMKAMMRSTAEATGRDPQIAEAMVDERVVVEGLVTDEQLLTFTASEAVANNYAQGIYNTMDEVITEGMGISNYKVVEHEADAFDNIIGFLTNPMVSQILLLLILGGLYFELQTPGVGFPLGIAITAAILFFAPLYIEGLAQYWEIALFGLGIILLILEFFFIPGFGVLGVSGIICMAASLVLSLVYNVDLDFSFTMPGNLLRAVAQVLFTIILAVVILFAFGGKLFDTKLFKRITLADAQKHEEGYTSHDVNLDHFVGRHGIAATDLRPSGAIEIDRERYDAYSDGEFIEKGTPLEVVRISGSNSMFVRVAEQQNNENA